MLPRGRRISRKLFPRHTDAHVLWRGEVLRVRCVVKTALHKGVRFAVVVSKKSYQTIAERNHFKRQVMAVLGRHLADFDRFRFGGYIISPNIQVGQISYDALSRDILTLVRECGK